MKCSFMNHWKLQCLFSFHPICQMLHLLVFNLFVNLFEDIKGVIRCRISRKGRQYNGQKKKDKGTFCLTEQYQVPGSQLLNYFLSGNNSRKLLDTKNIWITTQQKAINT
jgi:hypothetical protein